MRAVEPRNEALSGLCPWPLDPVASRYRSTAPTEHVVLQNHRLFSDLYLFREPVTRAGAVVLATSDRKVLACDYGASDLAFHWREALTFYAGVI